LAFLIAFAGVTRAAVVVSTFDTDTDGWFRGAGDNNSLVRWSATDGNPGGALTMQDEAAGTTDYWFAPAKFLGNQSASYGGTLAYDLKIDRTGQPFADLDVALVGGGHSVSGLFNITPTTTYQRISIPLTASNAWHADGSGGGPPPADFFQAILANLSALEIRAYYLNGAEVNTIDNITLAPVPEPTTLATLTLAAIPLLIARRRRG
jgi:alkaline phosphatase D